MSHDYKLLASQTNVVLGFTLSPKEFHSDFTSFLDCRKREWSNGLYFTYTSKIVES